MRRLIRWLGIIVLVLVVLAGIGWFVLHRPDVPFETLEAQYATAASRYVDLPGGIRAHYTDEGKPSGRVVVLVHGYTASTQTWDAWVPLLGTQDRVIRVDLPGHGLTRAPADYQASIAAYAAFIDAFADALKLPHFVLVGSSLGGNTAWAYALDHGGRLDALVLVDASGWPHDGERASSPAILRNRWTRWLLRDLDTTRLFRGGLRAAFANPDLATDAMVERYAMLARAPGHRDILIALQQAENRIVATPELLSRIAVPTLILQGAEDHLIPASDADRFHAAIPQSQLVTYPKVGHLPQEEAAQKSAADLTRFLAGLPPSL